MRCSDCKSRKYCDNADKVNYCAGYIFDDSKPKLQTNEEWLRSCTTEQLAEWIFNDRVEQSDWWYEQQGHTKAEVIEWLKQPHTFE